MSQVKTLWLHEEYLNQILSGHKTVEVRVGYENILRLNPGDRLRLNDRVLVTIRRIGYYADFEDLLAHEDPAAIAPGLPARDLLAALRQIYPREKELLGVVALEVALPRRYEAIFFDMGYTLVYFEPSQGIIVQEALRSVGVERSVAEVQAAVEAVWGHYYRGADQATFPATQEYDRQTQSELERRLLARLGLEGDEVAGYSHAIESRFSQPGVIRPYPEVPAVLELLKMHGYSLGIVSNWSWNLRDRVEQAGLSGYFDVVWASAYAGCNKPHADIFRQALARLPSPSPLPHQVLYVGDSYPHDVVGGRNAGLDVALLDRDGGSSATDCPIIRDLWGILGLLSVDPSPAG